MQIPPQIRGGARTISQAVSTTHEFSEAPAGTGTGTWESIAVESDSSGNIYYAGVLSHGAKVDFGCGNSLENPDDSLDDAFLVKYDSTGACQWQKRWGTPDSDPNYQRHSYRTADIAITDQDHVVIAYTQWGVAGTYQGDFAKGSRVAELNSSGTEVWYDFISRVADEYKEITAIDASDSSLVATGWHEDDFSFAGSSLPDPRANNDGKEAMILAWTSWSGSSRSEDWAESFGGTGKNVPSDIAVHDTSGDIAVVGNYDDDHKHLDGSSADQATNNSFFIQTVDYSAVPLDHYGSPGNPAAADDTESIESVDFAPNGDLYIAGDFHERLEPQTGSCTLVPNWCSANKGKPDPANYTDADTDYFLVRYPPASGDPTGAANIGNDAGFIYSDWNADNHTSPFVIRSETIAEVSATNSYAAITGKVSDFVGEGGYKPNGFVHFFDFSGFYPPSQPADYTGFDIKYRNDSEFFYGKSAAQTSSRLTVGGRNSDTSYSLGGGTLPGGDDFIVSYSF